MTKMFRGSVVLLGLAFVAACSSNGEELESVPGAGDGGRRDSGVASDSGRPDDTGTAIDTGTASEGGPSIDDAAILDSAPPGDGASLADAGTPSDAGALADSAVPVDGAAPVDATAPVDGSASDSGSLFDGAVADAGRDAGSTDSGAPADAAADGGPTDSGPSGDAGRDAGALVCAPPATTPTYASGIVWAAPGTWSQNRCTAATVDGAIAACFGSVSTLAACNAWKAANATCSACLLTPRTGAAMGPFITNPAVVAANDNPAGLDDAWVEGLISGCLSHFRTGCGPAYFSMANCIGAACDTAGNCGAATSAQVTLCEDEALGFGATAGVCRAPLLTAFATGGACVGVFPQDAGTALSGESCFSRGAARGEDTSTMAGIEAYLKRVALYSCGP